MTRVVSIDGLDEIVARLRESGRTVIGPVVRDGVITHDEVESVSDLPMGWTEEQEGGRKLFVSKANLGFELGTK